MATTKSTVFRVTGLPVGLADEVISSLRLAIKDHVSEEELQRVGRIIVTNSCYNDRTCVALLEWKGKTPEFLGALDIDPLSSWGIEMGDETSHSTGTFLDLHHCMVQRQGSQSKQS